MSQNLDYAESPICPHCGEKQMDAWEFSHEDQYVDCGSCGEPFSMVTHVSVRYSTSKIANIPDQS